jgi:SAM-dependent methyltransferase
LRQIYGGNTLTSVALGYQHFYEQLYLQLQRSGRPTWDSLFDETASFESFWTRSFIDRALPLLKCGSAQPTALELGCGTGQACCYLARRGFSVTGVDISATAIALARQAAELRRAAVRFICADVVDLFTRSEGLERFDVILDGNCLHCVVFEAERRAAYQAIYNLLEPGGFFLLNTMVREGHPLRYAPPLHFEEPGVLWVEREAANRLAPDAQGKTFETVRIDRRDYLPYRRLNSVEQLRRELAENGFRLLWEQVEPPRARGVESMFQAIVKAVALADSPLGQRGLRP